MATAFQKKLQDIQLKISEYSLTEAKLKAEKAQVELETAELNKEYIRQSWEAQLRNNNGSQGGIKS